MTEEHEERPLIDNRMLIPAIIQFMGEPAEAHLVDKVSEHGWHSWIVAFKTVVFRCYEGKVYLQQRFSQKELDFWEVPENKILEVRVCTLFPSKGYTNEMSRECYTLEEAFRYLAVKITELKALVGG